jgi:uncharacterized protein
MQIQLDKIGPDGLDVAQKLQSTWLNEILGADAPFAATGPGSLNLHLSRAGDVVYLCGRLDIQVSAKCARCLEAVELGMDVPLEVALFPRGDEPEAAIDGEISTDDMGVALYDNMEINLAGVIRDEIYLELPMSALCSEDCAGLCTHCGVNLNADPCQCPKAIDMRWSALKDISIN